MQTLHVVLRGGTSSLGPATGDAAELAVQLAAATAERDAERLRANPLGIYVNAINWSREMGQ